MFLKKQKRTLSFLLALVLVLSTFLSVAVFPASAAEGENYSVKLPNASEEQKFAGLQDAIDYVVSNGKPEGTVITLLQNEAKTLDYNENCTIPAGVTLLIPFDDAHTIFGDDILTESNDVNATKTSTTTYEKPSNYMTLDMQSGSSLTVENGGAIYLGGKAFTILNEESQLLPGYGVEENRQSVPSGPDGRIKMNGNAKITVGNGGKLYAFGYIYGTGNDILVEANNGAKVYEYFQITGWRGAASTMALLSGNGQDNEPTFPFNQYYVQNIEVPLKVNYGANEIVYATLFQKATSLISFIGDDGMFRIENDGYVIKDYIEESDRLLIETHCDATLGGLSLEIYHIPLSTSRFPYLPLTNNIEIKVAEGTVDVEENIALLPGTKLTVDERATVSIAEEKNVYVMDKSDWDLGSAMAASEVFPVAYTTVSENNVNPFDGMPSQRINPQIDPSTGAFVGLKGNIEDAEVDINGKAEVYGGFLTKGEGGNVHSSAGTGEIKYCADTESETVPFPSGLGGNQVKNDDYTSAYIKTDKGYVALGKDSDNNTVPGEYEIGTGSVSLNKPMYYVDWLDKNGNPCGTGIYSKGETPVFSGLTPEGEGEWIGWTLDPVNHAPVIPCYGPFAPVEEETTYYAVFAQAEPSVFAKHSLTLDGTIGVNFYVDPTESDKIPSNFDLSKFKIDFSWGNKYIKTNTYSEDPYTQEVRYSGTPYYDSESSKTYYQFTLPIAAKELNDTITAKLFYNGDLIETETYSGATYAYRLLGKTDEALNEIAIRGNGAGLRDLVISMLNYCSAAQDEFKYNTASHANDGLTAKQKKLTKVNTLKLKGNNIGDLPADVSYYGSLLNLGSGTSYMIVFRNNNKAEMSAAAKYADEDKTVTVSVNDYSNAVGFDLTNLPAAKVLSDIELTINGEYTSTVNAGSYISAVLNGNYNTELTNVITALYHYNQAAVEYFV